MKAKYYPRIRYATGMDEDYPLNKLHGRQLHADAHRLTLGPDEVDYAGFACC